MPVEMLFTLALVAINFMLQVYFTFVLQRGSKWRDNKDGEIVELRARDVEIEADSKKRDDALRLEIARLPGDFRDLTAKLKEDIVRQMNDVQKSNQEANYETRSTILDALKEVEIRLAENYVRKDDAMQILKALGLKKE